MDDLGGEWQGEEIAGAKAPSLGMSLTCSGMYRPGCRAHGPETNDLQETLTIHRKPRVSVDEHTRREADVG